MQEIKGIVAKLERAEENIANLKFEIWRFFEKSDYPVLPNNDRELALKASEYHKNLAIPPRFNHIVWHFSVGATDKDVGIEFPVFKKKPRRPNEIERFKGKIKRIKDPDVLGLIEGLQPYKAADPLDDPLFIIHKLDIVDKHRDILVCGAAGSLVVPREIEPVMKTYQRAHPELNPAQIARHFKGYGCTIPCVSFRNFGRREIIAVIPGLTDLFNYTVEALRAFQNL